MGFSLRHPRLESVLVCKDLAQSSESRTRENISERSKPLGSGEAAAGSCMLVPRDAPVRAGGAEITF